MSRCQPEERGKRTMTTKRELQEQGVSTAVGHVYEKQQ